MRRAAASGNGSASARSRPANSVKVPVPKKSRASIRPRFLSDTATESEYRAVLGKYYYTTRRVNGRTVSQRHIRIFTVSGHYSMAFDDVLVQASANIDQQSLDRLQPFDHQQQQGIHKRIPERFYRHAIFQERPLLLGRGERRHPKPLEIRYFRAIYIRRRILVRHFHAMLSYHV